MVPTEWLAMARSFLPVSDTFFFLNSSPIRALIASNILPASWPYAQSVVDFSSGDEFASFACFLLSLVP